MAENKLVGSLVLRTIDIDPARKNPSTLTTNSGESGPFDNTFGSVTALGCVVTWKNVNIRACLGGLYNKYNTFSLKLTSVQSRHNELISNNTLADAQFVIYMSGLPFSSGSCYNTRLGPTSQAALGCVNLISAAGVGSTTSIMSGLVSFDKPLQDILNITVELKNSNTLTANGSQKNQ